MELEHEHNDGHHHHHHENINAENERKTLIVIIFTIVTMIAEIFFGYISNSMALLADGCHMGTHAFALSIAFFAYFFINKIQNCENCEFVSSKISAFAGYTSSLFLLVTAVWIIIEAGERLLNPLNKHKDEDYNFKAAYLHILTDALTSVFAIVALITGKYIGWTFLDPIMGFVGGALILKWSIGLIKDTSKILLDLKLLKPVEK